MTSLGRVLQGRAASYTLLQMIKEPSVQKASVYKASVNASKESTDKGSVRFVAIKDLVREGELKVQQDPVVTGSKYLRQLVDIIERQENEDWSPSLPSVNKRMVLEWMDTDLWHIRPFRKPFANPDLPAIVSKSVLEALAVFHSVRSVHTDVNPNNILISDADTPNPCVKISDLDNAFFEGVGKGTVHAQSFETRAPEVWRGSGVWHSADIWSLGITIAHWLLSRTIFGREGKLIENHDAAWCLAKIVRLVGPIDVPEDPDYKEEFELANELAESTYEHPETAELLPWISCGTLREELLKLPRGICSEPCIDFIEHLLVIDPEKRPTAEVALRHPFVSTIVI